MGAPGAGGWKFSGMRVLTFVNRTATFCFCLSVTKCSLILRGKTGARFDGKLFKSAKGFLGFYTVAHKIRRFILFWQFLEFTSLHLRNDKEYRHISSTKNKGGYLPCAVCHYTGVSFLSCLQGGSKHHWYNFLFWTFLTIFGVYFLISQKRQRISAHNEYQK